MPKILIAGTSAFAGFALLVSSASGFRGDYPPNTPGVNYFPIPEGSGFRGDYPSNPGPIAPSNEGPCRGGRAC